MGSDEVEALRAENAVLRARVEQLEQLRGGEDNFLPSVLAAVPAFIIHADLEMRIRYINRIQPGLEMSQVIGSNGYDYVAPEYRDTVRACTERALQTGVPQPYEAVGDGPHGEPTYYEAYVARVTEPDGRLGVCLVAFDVSRHRQREQALRESEEKLRVALAATGIGLWSWDLQSGEVAWDDRMKELCGTSEPLAFDAMVERLVHPGDRPLVREWGHATRASRELSAYSYRIVRPDGTVRWVLTSATMLRDDHQEPLRLLGGNLDITEQRQLEEKLRQAQKLEALGSLTAGIAHNLNNTLMVLLPALELLARVVPPAQRQLARDARESAERGADHIRRLMTFAGQRRAAPAQSHDVGEVVRSALRMCRGSFDRHIELVADVAPDLPPIQCDAAGLEQVLFNVLINARDALADVPSPRIRVVVDSLESVNPTVSLAAARYARVRVEDNGAGMTPEVQSKIFEPFFTTKSAAGGSGLGLATSYAIVRQYQGWMECSSRCGEGTVMAIHLPVAKRICKDASAPAPQAPGSGRIILLIDDVDAIRRVVSELLREDGHRVVAVGADEALVAAEQHPDAALVMLDRSMPGSPGHTLVGSLRERLERARIVYFTGHDVPEQERQLVDGVIRKPLSGDALSAAVRAALTDEVSLGS